MAAKRKKKTSTRRSGGTRKKAKRRAPRKVKVLSVIAAGIALAEIIQEQIAAGTFTALRGKQYAAAFAAFIAGGRKTVDFESLVKILGPTTGLMVWNKVRTWLRIRAPTVANITVA